MTLVGPETLQAAKARGAFYTPAPLTRFMARWAIRSAAERTMEPSCGDGAFVAAAAERYAELGIDDLAQAFMAVEREAVELDKAKILAPTADFVEADFFELDPGSVTAVDAVLGNPPYIRYHGFAGSDRTRALTRASEQGVTLSRLTSSWAPFVVHSMAFLKPRGRLALVLPAELLHTDYARPIREHLAGRFGSIVVVAFDRPVFEAQVDAVLLLASDDDATGLRVVRVRDDQQLDGLDVSDPAGPQLALGSTRWSRGLDAKAAALYGAMESSTNVLRLGSIASVDIGFVSGADGYFVMSHAEAIERGIPADVLTPTVRRPGDIPGLLASNGDVQLLLDMHDRRPPLPTGLAAYLAHGEREGISQRYKCRVRSPWYRVPLPKARPEAFLPYMSHHGPRLIVNDVGARSTNLVHGVSLGIMAPPAAALAVAMAGSLTLLSAEIEGRSYGGGVLKLETREAERLLVPKLDEAIAETLIGLFGKVDALVRAGDIRSAASLVDDALGLDHVALWGAYQAFRGRRAERRRSKRAT